MSTSSAFTGGLALQAALIVAIGAQNTFVLVQGLRREHVGAIVAFCAAADLALTALGVAGLGAAISRVPHLATLLTLGGAAFLAWYGLGASRRAARPGAIEAETRGQALSRRAALARAAGFTLLNPGVYVDTLLVVGATGAGYAPGDRTAFVIGAGLASLVWFALLGFGARLAAPLFARPGAWRLLDGAVAATMLSLAAGLLARAAALS